MSTRAKFVSLSVLAAFSFVSVAHAAGLPVFEGFQSYTVGQVADGSNGGKGWSTAWSGDTAFTIEDSLTLGGGKSLQVSHTDGVDKVIQRSFPSKTSGTLHWLQQKSGGSHSMYVALASGDTLLTDVGVDAVGQGCGTWVMLYAGGSDCFATANFGSWDSVDLEFDTTLGQYRVSVNGAAFTPWRPLLASAAGVDKLVIYTASSGPGTTVGNWDQIRIR